MPIYEYHCGCCERCFEALILKADEPSPCCPHCGADKVERLLSSFSCKSSSGNVSDREAAGCGGSGFS